MDKEISAVILAQAGKIYAALADTAATVTVENATARIQAVKLAADLVATKVSLRAAAVAAGRKADTSLDRYMTVARAATDAGKVKVKPPTGAKSWADAIATLSLRALVAHIRSKRTSSRAPMAPEARAKRILDSALRNIFSLTLRSKSKKRKGIIVAPETITTYVNAWLEAGLDMENAAFKALTVPVVTRKPQAEQHAAEQHAA